MKSLNQHPNPTQDGRWTYTWDAENRLVRLVANTGVGPQQRLDFAYDSQGRRIGKKVWNNTAGTGSPAVELQFVYDGWNLVAELTPAHAALRTYTWGLDLSGSEHGAGGVGGLLTTWNSELGTWNFAACDGNGNVTALVNAANGAVTAQYEYDAFGRLLRATGPLALVNPFTFSTKFRDGETGFLYYGHRYYDPSTGRWLSRDPIEERGGKNIYGFIANNPIRFYDKLGLQMGFSGFGEVDWQHSQPWDSAAIANWLCPFKCNGKAINPFKECCCKGKIYNKEKVKSGVRICDAWIPGWAPFRHQWVEVDGMGLDSACGSISPWGNALISDAQEFVSLPESSKSCSEITLSECEYDVASYRQGVKDLIKTILAGVKEDGRHPDYSYFPGINQCHQFVDAMALAPLSAWKRDCKSFSSF